MTELEDKIRDMYSNETVRDLLNMGGPTAQVVDALLDTFAGFASMGDDAEALIDNLPDILVTTLDQVNFSDPGYYVN